MVANLAPSDVDLRSVDFESIANNTIILHESPVSSDKNHLFNFPDLGPMISPVLQMQFFFTMLTLGTLLFCNQVPVSRARFLNRISLETKILTP